MKYRFLAIVILCLTLTSCSLDDNRSNFYVDTVAIESVIIPDEFIFGETHQITVTYNRPSNCYVFNNFLSQANGNEIVVVVLNTIYTDSPCEAINESVEEHFDFTVTSQDPYVFKFYQGVDDEGNDSYYSVEVPVVD